MAKAFQCIGLLQTFASWYGARQSAFEEIPHSCEKSERKKRRKHSKDKEEAKHMHAVLCFALLRD